MTTMIVDHKESKPRVIIQEQYYPGGSIPWLTTTYAPTVLWTIDTVNYTSDSRPKPVDLLQNLTPLPRRSSSKVVMKEIKQVLTWRTFYQNQWHNCYRYQWRYNPPAILPYGSETLDWALAMRLKIQAHKVSFAETIGEWREAVGMLEGAAGIMSKSWRYAKKLMRSRNKRRVARDWFRSVFGRGPDHDLELMDAVALDLAIKFGLEPTANLLGDTVSQLSKLGVARKRLQVTLKNVQNLSRAGYVSGSITAIRKTSVKAICYVSYDVNDSEFTTGNIAESLWAGTSLSFMVDWFIDVSSYLSSFNAMKGVTSITGTVSTSVVTKVTDNALDGVVTGGTLTSPGSFEYKSFEREVITTLPYPQLPHFEPPDGDLYGKLASAIEVLLSIRR